MKTITTSTTLQLHYSNYYYNITTSTTSTPLQLQVQQQLQLLRYTTLHPGVVSGVTTATIATTPKKTAPTTFRSISGFVLPSVVHHNNQPLL